MEISMILRFLAVALFAVTTVSSQTPPSLPSSFQQRTIHSPEGADIFVRWGGSGPVVVERLVVMEHPCSGLIPGTTFSSIPAFGTSTSMDRMQNGWWRGGSVSTLAEYGMTLPAIQVGPTNPPEIFLPLHTHTQAECA